MYRISLLVHDTREGTGLIYAASSPVIRMNSSFVCFQNFSATPSSLKPARSFSTLGPELSPAKSTEYTPLPVCPLVPLATATSPVNGTPEIASPSEPAGYLQRFWSQHTLIQVRSMGHKTPLRGRTSHFSRSFSSDPEVDTI